MSMPSDVNYGREGKATTNIAFMTFFLILHFFLGCKSLISKKFRLEKFFMEMMAICNHRGRSKTREIFAHYCQYFAWPRYLPSALPAVPIFSILISPKYEPALSDAITVFPLSPTTWSRPRFTMYISFPTSPGIVLKQSSRVH